MCAYLVQNLATVRSDLFPRFIPNDELTGLVLAADIEKSLTVSSDEGLVEEWLELANGCTYFFLLALYAKYLLILPTQVYVAP